MLPARGRVQPLHVLREAALVQPRVEVGNAEVRGELVAVKLRQRRVRAEAGPALEPGESHATDADTGAPWFMFARNSQSTL